MNPGSIGIKHGYPRIRRYFRRLADVLCLIRPLTLVAPILIATFGSLLVLGSIGAFWEARFFAVYLALILVAAQASGQVFNQAYEAKLDAINKPYRPIPSGRVSEHEGKVFAYLLMGLALSASAVLGIWFFATVLLMISLSVSYTVVVKRRLYLNLAWMALGRGALPVLALYLAFDTPVTFFTFGLAALAFWWCFAFQSTKDFTDVKGDEQFGIRTLPVVYGVDGATKGIGCLAVSFFGLGMAFILIGVLPPSYLWLLVFLAVPAVGIMRTLRRETGTFENSVAWILFYAGLGLIYVISALINLFIA